LSQARNISDECNKTKTKNKNKDKNKDKKPPKLNNRTYNQIMTATDKDPFFLERFIKAQDECYVAVVQELASGKKQTHWMWFIFPQLSGLGSSDFAIYYGIDSLEGAKAYWSNGVLRARYEECLQLILASQKSAIEVLGKIDARKLQSSLTLFLKVEPSSIILNQALDQLYQGQGDQKSLDMLKTSSTCDGV